MNFRLGRHWKPRVIPSQQLILVDRLFLSIPATKNTWFCLKDFDHTFSNVIGLPDDIRICDVGDTEAWVREQLHLQWREDSRLASSIDRVRPWKQKLVNIPRSALTEEINASLRHSTPPRIVLRPLKDFGSRHQYFNQRWFVRVGSNAIYRCQDAVGPIFPS